MRSLAAATLGEVFRRQNFAGPEVAALKAALAVRLGDAERAVRKAAAAALDSVSRERRWRDVVQGDAAQRGADNIGHAKTLLLDGDYDAVALKAAYRKRCKDAHPDVRVSDDVPDINACRVAFEALSADLDRKASDASYETLGGSAKSTFAVPPRVS